MVNRFFKNLTGHYWQSIVDYGRSEQPLFDTDYFTHAIEITHRVYWSSTPSIRIENSYDYAYGMDFGQGTSGDYDKSGGYANGTGLYVWAVRGGKSIYDFDGDGMPDNVDNCQSTYNANQEDADEDGAGDICDNCTEVPNTDQADEDDDGIGNACDYKYWKARYEECSNTPTNISLSSLKALSSNKKVTLNWQTESESENAGFNIWRAEGFKKINESIIPALGSPLSGSEYDFVDQWVLNGKRYFYLLEDIDTNGISTFHGPVKAVPRWWHGVSK